MCLCVRTEESVFSAEQVQDWDPLLEPTLLKPLRGDGTNVSLYKVFGSGLLPSVELF